jgi:hypothetical protein
VGVVCGIHHYLTTAEQLGNVSDSAYTHFANEFIGNLAERQGFEPWEPVRVHLISSQADSTALAPLRRAFCVTTSRRRQSFPVARISPLFCFTNTYADWLRDRSCSVERPHARVRVPIVSVPPVLRISEVAARAWECRSPEGLPEAEMTFLLHRKKILDGPRGRG